MLVPALLAGTTTAVHAAGSPSAAPRACAEATVAKAAAHAMARACGRQVEVVEARTETDLVFALPDGTSRLERRNRPVRVWRADGSWTPVDTSLKFGADGSVVPGATSVGLVFSGGGVGPLVRMTSAGRRLEVGSPFGALPRPVLDGNSATYPGILPDVDLRLTADSEGYTEVLVVKSRAAAANPALRKISFPFSGPGLSTVVDSTGNLRVVDEAGATVFGGSPPTMWDSGHAHAEEGSHTHTRPPDNRHGKAMLTEVASAAGVSRSAGAAGRPGEVSLLSVTPSQEFLMDPATVYPVLIDPPVTRYKLAWTYVSADCSDCRFWNSSEWAQTGPIDGHTHRSFFRMSMEGLAYRSIISASFDINLVWTASSYWKETDLWDVGSISSSTSWGNQPAYRTYLGTVTLNAPANGVSWNITEQIKYASSKAWGDETVGLYSRSDSDGAYGKLWSNNPAMVVVYNDPPHLPFVQPLSPCRTQCMSPAVVRSRTPVLRATVSDPNGGQVRGDFEVRSGPSDSAALLASTTTGPVSSFAIAAWTVPSGVLSDSTYYWRVRARDELNWVSGWTGWQTMTVDTAVPSPPAVSSVEYPEGRWGAAVGTRGRFTFRHLPPPNPANPGAPRVSDVVAFQWSVVGQGGTSEVAASMSPGCTTECAAVATVEFTPATDMGKTMWVYAIDRAGNVGDTYYPFKVSPLPNRCWRWLLDETSGTTAPDTGNTDSGDEICGPIGSSVAPRNGYLLGGVGWVSEPGAAPRDRFARFDGVSGEIYMESVLDATKSFTVMAWVRPADLSASNGYQTLISQPGSRVDRFALRYSKDANGGTGGWCFDMHSSDAVGARTSACATGTVGDSGPPTVGQWVHLAGVYDAVSGRIQIHVMGNQESCNGEMFTAGVSGSWNGLSWFEIGLSYAGHANSDAFKGDIDHVYAFQRPLAPSEICRQVQ